MDSKDLISLILGVLFGIDQILAHIPSVKANCVFQVITNILTSLASLIKK